MENKKINIKSGIHKHEAGIKTYIFIWIILLMFTAITVMVANFNIPKIAILVCLGIAVVKSILVFLYFMHLRYEKRLLIKLLMPGALLLLAVFIVLTFSDVFTR